jgi:hypothetical protein
MEIIKICLEIDTLENKKTNESKNIQSTYQNESVVTGMHLSTKLKCKVVPRKARKILKKEQITVFFRFLMVFP